MLKEKDVNLPENFVKEKKRSQEIDCVMNRLNIFNENETYLSYTCNSCKGKPDNICYLCLDKCHLNHNISTKNVNEKKVNIRKTPCSCALNDHQVVKKPNSLRQVRTDSTDLQCTINEVLHYSDIQFYYMDPTTHMYYCMFCLDFCLGIFSHGIEDPLQEYIKREKSKFAQGAPLCACSNKDCHAPFYENVNCLITLITSPNFDQFLNRVQIPGQILSKLSLVEKYLDPVKVIHSEIKKNYTDNNLMKYQKETLPKVYLNSLQLLKCFSESYGKDTFFLANPNIQKLYNMDFLLLILSQTEDHFLIETKINCLLFFRKCYVLPKLKSKEWWYLFSNFENVSPLHRLMFKRSIKEFFEVIEIDKNVFLKFLNKIHILILKSFTGHKLADNDISSLIVEYMKWLNLLISFRFSDDDMPQASLIYNDIVDRFLQIAELLHSKKSLENLIKKYVEFFVIKVMLNNNDEIFYRKVYENLYYEKRRKLTNNVNNNANNNNNNYSLNKSLMASSARQRLLLSQSYIELDEEVDEEGDINANLENPENNFEENLSSQFCFEKEDQKLKIIKALFIFNKEETDTSNEIQQEEIYDILVNKEDYYVETITSLTDSNLAKMFCVENEKYLNIFLQSSSIIEKQLNNIFNENDIGFFSSIKISLNFLEENKIRYYESSIKEQFFYESSLKMMSDFKSYLSSLRLGYENSHIEEGAKPNDEKETNVFFKQVYLLKIGLFDALLNIWCIFNSNKRLSLSLGNDKINFINKEIINNLKSITDGNSFLISLFFNENILSIFFPDDRSKMTSENKFLVKQYYLHMLHILSKQKYKVNFLKFVKIITNDLEILEQEYEENVKNKIERKNYEKTIMIEIHFIIKSFNKTLKISADKTKGKINNLIATKLKSLLVIDTEEEPSFFYHAFDLFKLNIGKKVDDWVKDFILSIFQSINSLDDSYFSLITDDLYLNIIDEIVELLNLFFELDPKSRMIFSKIYARYQVQCPFRILKPITSIHLDNMTKNVDENLIGDLKGVFEDENRLKNLITITEESVQNSDEDENPLLDIIGIKNNPKNNPIESLNPILNNLEMYRRIIIKFNNSHFKNNNKFFVKYFTQTVLFPSVFSIYKVLYFSSRITAKFKYLTYKFVYLFFECAKHFLSLLLNDTMNLMSTEENERHLYDYFKTDKPNQNIKEFLYNLSDDLQSELNIFNQQNFEPLRLNNVMERWVKFISKFKIIDFLTIDKEIMNKLIQQDFKLVKEQSSRVNAKANIMTIYKVNSKIKEFIKDYLEKKSNIEENVLVDFFKNVSEEDLRGKEIKKTITLDLLFRIDALPKSENFISIYDENNSILFETINVLFKADPDSWQNAITKTCSVMKKQIYGLIRSHSVLLFQFIMNDFHKLQTKAHVSNSIKDFEHVLEFLRLLCENHNKIYQTLLIQIYISYGDIYFIDFMLKLPAIILNNIDYYKNKKEILKYFKPVTTDYFNGFLNSISDYLIEVIQGAYSNNFKKISESKDFVNYYELAYKSIDQIEKGEEYEIFFAQFIRFLSCYLDENSNVSENKLQIIKKLNPQKLLILLMHSFKKMYYFLENKDKVSVTISELNDYKISEDACENFTFVFLNDETIFNSHLFILSSGIFKYFKTAILWKCGEKVQKLLDNLKKLTELKILPDKNKNQIILKREVFNFFNKVVKEVEIFYKFKENMEEIELNKFKDLFEEDFYDFDKIRCDTKIELQGIQKVVYLVHPDSLFLKDSDLKIFNDNAPFENFNIKLNYVLNYYDTLVDNLQMRKVLWRSDNPLLKILFKLNYQKALYISVAISIFINLLILITSSFSFKIDDKQSEDFNNYEYNYENGVVPYNSNDKNNPFDDFTFNGFIFYFSCFHLIYLLFIILNFLSFATYKMQKFVTVRKDLSFSGRIYNFFSFLLHHDISPLVWNFVTGAVAIIDEKYKFMYSLQLFTIFNLVPTMQSVIYSVRVRYKQFLSAALLIMIMLLFYSSISFYLFRNEYYNKDLDENLCSSFLHCYLTLFTNGIRAGAGLGFPIQSIKNRKYFSEFIFEWVFYFSVILIMLNVINGIIVDTFQALREQNNLKEDMKENVCYICSINRSKFEVRGVNFNHHKNVEHGIMNYFYYILKVRLTNEQDLNSLDYQVLNSIKELRTDFFPVKKALSLGNA